jgi:hypothetical protein
MIMYMIPLSLVCLPDSGPTLARILLLYHLVLLLLSSQARTLLSSTRSLAWVSMFGCPVVVPYSDLQHDCAQEAAGG